VFLLLRPFLFVPRRVVISVRCAVGAWVCAEVSNCFATAQSHPLPLLSPPRGPAGWKAKKLPNLLSTIPAIWTNWFLTTYFMLAKNLHRLAIANLSHIFNEYRVWGEEEIKASLGQFSTGCAFWELRKEQTPQSVPTFHSFLESKGWK